MLLSSILYISEDISVYYFLQDISDDDAFDEADGNASSLSTVTTPDSVFPSAPSTPPIMFDVIPSSRSYTPVPVTQSLLTLSTGLPTSPLSTTSSTSPVSPIAAPIVPSVTPSPSITPTSETSAQPPAKTHLQITSSSDSASSSSANNSPGSAIQKSNRRNRLGSGAGRLQRSKHPGNMLLAKVSE